MIRSITIARPLLERALREITGDPERLALFRAGVNRHPGEVGLLARDFAVLRRAETASHPFAQGHCFVLSFPAAGISLLPMAEEGKEEGIQGILVLGQEEARGTALGLIRAQASLLPVDLLKLPGPGMVQLPLLAHEARTSFDPPWMAAGVPVDPTERERWSRTIGALGGEEIWRRLICLHPGVVGVGRSGSLVASTLARLGIRRVTLIDPDLVERHNLDGMEGVTERDLGRSKVEAVAGHISRLRPGLEAGGLVGSIGEREGIIQAKGCDLLFSCVDDDAGRLAVATLASLYSQPLIDIGTGIFDHQGERLMGADIRLVLPGNGCLLCWGGLAGEKEEALDRLKRGQEMAHPPWFQERAGSLRSLNGMAVHLAVQMLLDLVAHRIGRPLWARLMVDPEGRVRVDYLDREDRPECTLCKRLGLGDEAISWGRRP